MFFHGFPVYWKNLRVPTPRKITKTGFHRGSMYLWDGALNVHDRRGQWLSERCRRIIRQPGKAEYEIPLRNPGLFHLHVYIYIYTVYIYRYVYVCMCVCVCICIYCNIPIYILSVLFIVLCFFRLPWVPYR